MVCRPGFFYTACTVNSRQKENSNGAATKAAASGKQSQGNHPYVGMWVTADGYIRHELLPDGRYDEARGTKRSAYRGRADDTGFTADGDFRDDVLYHAGMVLYRERV